MKTYQDYLTYVSEQTKVNGNEFLASDEYKKMYPIMMNLYKVEGHSKLRNTKIAAKRRFNKMIKEATIETGCPVGLLY